LPGHAGTFNNRGNAYHDKGDDDRAIQDYNEAIRLKPSDPTAFNNRGVAYKAKGDNDRAIQDFSEAIRLKPDYATAFNNRGSVFGATEDNDRALQDYEEALRLRPNYASALHNRGRWYLQKGDLERAIQDYERAIQTYDQAIRTDPKDSLAYFNRSVAQMLAGRTGAASGFRAMIEIVGWNGRRATYSVILGYIAARRDGDGVSATQFLRDADGKLDKSWPYPAVRFLRGDIDDAALLNLATDDAQRTEAHCYVGFVSALSGRRADAVAHHRWVRDHGKHNFYEYALSLAELERLERSTDGDSKP